jgi:hypothetical protein
MIGRRGLPGYMAVCLYLGYVWLVVSGLVRLAVGTLVVDAAYDLALHAVFLGFALGLVFAHAPIIFPAVTGRPLAYRPSFLAPLLLLQASLALRAGGDLANVALARQLGGIGNELAIVLFLAVTAGAIRTGARSTAFNPRPPVLEGRVSIDEP